MTPDDLRKIAEAATKGPWEWDGAEIGQPFTCPEPWETVVSNEVECGAFCLGGVARGIEKGADAEFIATFNPERVLELLDWQESAVKAMDWGQTKIDRLEARLAAVEKLHKDDGYGDCGGCLEVDPGGYVPWPCPTIKAIKGGTSD